MKFKKSLWMFVVIVVLAVISISKIFSIGNYTVTPGSPVVFDSRTGLTWQRCMFGAYTDDNCTLIGNDLLFDWSSAMNQCASLNGSVFGGKTGWRLPNINELLSIVTYDFPSIDSLAIDLTVFPNTPPFGWVDRIAFPATACSFSPTSSSPTYEPSVIIDAAITEACYGDVDEGSGDQRRYPYFWSSTTNPVAASADTALAIEYDRGTVRSLQKSRVFPEAKHFVRCVTSE